MKHILTLITALLLLPLTVLQAADATKPNVLFIIADDLGWGDLRCYGNQVVDTPTLDELAKVGVRFTDHYSPSALCAPARAGFLTGRFNHRTGAVDVPSNRGLERHQPNNRRSAENLPRLLGQQPNRAMNTPTR